MRAIRDAKEEDAATLCEAERRIVQQFDGLLVSEPEELRESNFNERIRAVSDGTGKYLIAEQDGAPVAHACLWPMGLKKVSHVLRLDMCVHLGHWRQGHGEHLLRTLLNWARAAPNAHKIELLVRASNSPAFSLYQKLGFIEEGRLKSRIKLRSGHFIDDITMAIFPKSDA